MTRYEDARARAPIFRESLRRQQLEHAGNQAPRVPDGRPRPIFEEPVAMRDPARPNAPETLAPPAPSAAVIALHRAGFGPRPGDVDAFQALGANDTERLTAWVDRQLDPASIDDSAAEARVAQAGFVTLEQPLTQLWLERKVNYVEWSHHVQPYDETVLATFLRAVHSERQLFELLVDFWHNHFSIYAYEFGLAAIWPVFDREVIRAHALGNFRTMLEAVASAPPMLWYLDNNDNSLEDPNENYAREMLELHTLGADAYYGSIAPEDVPTDGDGVPLGFTETDVVEAARCLTGWTVRDRDWNSDFGDTGEFFYYPDWHDDDPKTFMGNPIPANQPAQKDGRDLFDLVVSHPACARFIATKLCRRLVGDVPPQAVLDAAAATFTATLDAPDQLRQVVRTILLHPAFLTSWGDKVKRPFDAVVAALRGADGDLPFEYDEPITDWFLWMFYQTGHFPFSWHPPNGYPDFKGVWNSTSPRVMTWRVANMLISAEDETEQPFLDFLSQTPPDVRSSEAIVSFWSERILGRPLPTAEYETLVEFMAQGRNPTFDLPLDSDPDTQDRLRSLGALIFQSPSFLWR